MEARDPGMRLTAFRAESGSAARCPGCGWTSCCMRSPTGWRRSPPAGTSCTGLLDAVVGRQGLELGDAAPDRRGGGRLVDAGTARSG